MGRIVIGCLLILGIALTGCTTTKSTGKSATDLSSLSKKEVAAYNANPDNTDRIVCKREKPVGSSIPVKVCRKISKIEDRQARDQQALRTIQNTTAPIN